MKAERKESPPVFEPITLTIETEEELRGLQAVFNNTSLLHTLFPLARAAAHRGEQEPLHTLLNRYVTDDIKDKGNSAINDLILKGRLK